MLFMNSDDVARVRRYVANGWPDTLRAEWNRATTRATQLGTSPAVMTGVASGCPRPSGGIRGPAGQAWEHGVAAYNGNKLYSAGFVALALNDRDLANRVIGVLVSQARTPGMQFLRRECSSNMPTAGDLGFAYAFQFFKRVLAWDFVRDMASPNDRAVIDAFLRKLCEYFSPALANKNRQAWQDPYNGNFVPKVANNSGGSSQSCYDGGPRAGKYGGGFFNNRLGMYAAVCGAAGTLIDHAEAIREARAYVKGAIIGMVGRNFITESHRGTGAEPWKGMEYPLISVGQWVMIACARANVGDRDLLEWQTEAGIGATENAGRRGLIRAVEILADLDAHRVMVYAPGHRNENGLLDFTMPRGKIGAEGVFALLHRFTTNEKVQAIYTSRWPAGRITSGAWDHLPPCRAMML